MHLPSHRTVVPGRAPVRGAEMERTARQAASPHQVDAGKRPSASQAASAGERLAMQEEGGDMVKREPGPGEPMVIAGAGELLFPSTRRSFVQRLLAGGTAAIARRG